MRRILLAAAAAGGGLITRHAALEIVRPHVLADAISDGALSRLFPNVYALPGITVDGELRRRAALLYRPDAALSHLDALAIWDLPGNAAVADPPVHLTCAGDRSDADIHGLRLHRRGWFTGDAPDTLVRQDLRVVRLEQAVVESWPLLSALDQRVPALVAIRDRRTTAARLLETLDRQPRVAGAAEMRGLFELLGLGIHSHLEAWGHAHVFSDPRLPPSRAQVKVVLPNGRTVYLDRLYDEELVNVELDGAAYHGTPGQRERDLRRDSALAALGYVTVRFSHPRLHADAASATTELLATLEVRRRQFGLRPA